MNYKKSTDNELWQYCRKDDLKAYNMLFDRYAVKLYKVAARYIKETEVAEELVMDLLFNLWQKRNQLSIEGDISSYLFRWIRNLVIDQLRKKIPLRASFDQVPKELMVVDEQADHGLLFVEVENHYKTVLDGLSPQRRKVFLLSREKNMTYAEIATETGLSVNTVENYMVSALGTLRNNMKGYASIPLVRFSVFFFCPSLFI